MIQPGETIPETMLTFIGAQVGIAAEELAAYGARRETRYEHSAALQELYGYRPFEGQARREMLQWLALLTVVLADGVNLGLRKMADACKAYSFWELLRVADWHVREETYERALSMLIEAQRTLPLARLWGMGETSSSDEQHFPSGGAGEAMNLVNARYGTVTRRLLLQAPHRSV